ncbi:MAG: AAA family ATPase [Bryobacteraceae bacterium]
MWQTIDAEPDLDNLKAKWSDAGTLVTRRVSDVEAKPVCWLWPTRIPRGKLTIIAGDPGLGKSQITASVAAVVTRGGRWPVDRQDSDAGDALFLSAEDDTADTLRPRLEAAGADLNRVHVIEGVIAGHTGEGTQRNRLFSLQSDLESLGRTLVKLREVAAVVIDPISAYLGEADSHKNAEVRSLLAPLGELAALHNTAIIGVSHLNKAAGTQAMMRVSGSLAFVAAARAAYLVAADPQERSRRVFLPLKNNLGPDAMGLAYRIEGVTVPSAAGPLDTSRIAWESDAITMSVDEAVQSATPQKTSELEEAKGWLERTLADGLMTAKDVNELATRDGISEKTLRRAREALGIKPAKRSMKGPWSWSLPKLPTDA